MGATQRNVMNYVICNRGVSSRRIYLKQVSGYKLVGKESLTAPFISTPPFICPPLHAIPALPSSRPPPVPTEASPHPTYAHAGRFPRNPESLSAPAVLANELLVSSQLPIYSVINSTHVYRTPPSPITTHQ